MKTLIIGGGRGCLAVLELIQNKRLISLSPEIVGVVDPNPDAPGVQFAREHGLPVFHDMYSALGLPGLELVIELTGSDHVREEVFHRLPPRCRFMDHHMARVFWDLDEVAQHLLDELEQRIQLELEMREDQRRLQDILDSLPDAVMVVDHEAHIERVNRRYEELTGLRMWQVTGKPCEAVSGAGPECGGPFCPRERVMQTGEPLTVVQPWSCLAIECPGEDCYFEVTANRIRDRRGRPGVVIASREVTEQVLLKRETEDQARRFLQIVGAVHGLITIRDLQGRYQLANPAACRFFGLTEEAFLGKTHQELFPPEVADVFQRNDEDALGSGGEHTTREEVFVWNGRERILITERILLTDYRREPVALCAVSRDVTESRRLQQELVHAERDAAMGKLAAGVAHELNNPLTGILTFAEELLEEAPEDADIRSDLEVILRETLRCRQIVKDLLDYSRRDGLHMQTVSLESIVERTLGLVQKQAAFHNIDFQVALRDGPLLTRGDPNQLQQVLLNLVINARDAQDGHGHIAIEGGRARDRVWVAVADEGVGIPPELQDRIFEPFYTTKGARGNGLGLAAVKSIVERHGGEIRLESAPGSGSRFEVWLPAESGTRKSAPTPSQNSPSPADAASAHTKPHAAAPPRADGRPPGSTRGGNP